MRSRETWAAIRRPNRLASVNPWSEEVQEDLCVLVVRDEPLGEHLVREGLADIRRSIVHRREDAHPQLRDLSIGEEALGPRRGGELTAEGRVRHRDDLVGP